MKQNIKLCKLKSMIQYILVAVISLLVILFVINIRHTDLTIPHSMYVDYMLGEMSVKSLQENGLSGLWYNPRIGAPQGSHLIDTPFMDYIYTLQLYGIIKLCGSSTMALYILYFMTFSMSAVSMLWLLKRFKVNDTYSVFLAIFYSLTPYHFMRGMQHLTLSNYYMIPIAVYLAWLIYKVEYKGVFPKYYSYPKRLLYIIALVWIGLGNIYYAFFTMLLVLTSILFKMIEKKTWKPLRNEMISFFVLAVSFITGIAPKIVFGWINGVNSSAGIRSAAETEYYALKLIQLLMPPNYTRPSILNSMAKNYMNSTITYNENSYASLGVIAGIGFLLACIWFIRRFVRRDEEQRGQNDKLLDLFSFWIITMLLYAMPGGIGDIVSRAITPQIRCLNRISIVIATVSIAFLGVSISKIRWNNVRKSLRIAAYIMICFIVFYIDIPVYSNTWQDGTKELDGIYRTFFAEVEGRLESGDSVYQLPMLPFPEEAPYSHLRGYCYTDTIKWSFGGLKGRDDAAMDLYVDYGCSDDFLKGIIEAGFDGVYIDNTMYNDAGEQINLFYISKGYEPLYSSDGTMSFYKF